VAGFVVVEIAIDVQARGEPTDAGIGPTSERPAVVVALVSSVWAVQAQVDEVGGDLPGRNESVELVDAECGLVACEQIQCLVVDPGWCA
jgi:hypothetical protein